MCCSSMVQCIRPRQRTPIFQKLRDCAEARRFQQAVYHDVRLIQPEQGTFENVCCRRFVVWRAGSIAGLGTPLAFRMTDI